ncbi:hypothetical protein C0Q70_13530 [Pomacea canaliculata]|uniref:Uncharacterized protein n=1 Tax=Pomacea canaliculata TaxID=400727 RepID=A0A2T7NXH4_POMCA|nr:hypothetical protein C0Q70_13530 [Pomacea canaliculata]
MNNYETNVDHMAYFGYRWKIKCAIPDKVSSWVAHGLWPTQKGSQEPIKCNKTWKLDVNELKTLRPKLDYRWASLRVDFGVERENENLWRHEWMKHGTCATTLSALKNPFHYFNATLSLMDSFNLLEMLTEEGIKPDQKKTYDYEDIRAAVQKHTGVTPCLVCIKDKEVEKTYLREVEIWLDKDFQPVNCLDNDLPAPGTHAPHPLIFHSELHVTYGALQALHKSAYNTSHCPSTGIFYTPVHSKPAS